MVYLAVLRENLQRQVLESQEGKKVASLLPVFGSALKALSGTPRTQGTLTRTSYNL